MAEIILEPTGSSDFERCECCGENSHWTLGKVADEGAHFDLILGRWGEDATRADRYAVSLEYRRTDQGPAFMVIDATERPIAHNELVARALRRHDVIGTELAAHAFELVDAIWLNDRRIGEVTGLVYG